MLSFLLGFFLEALIGMIGFWFLEVSSLLFVYMLFSFFFSGHMFPIDMLPGVWRWIVQLIPLQYLAYFPGGRVPGQDPRTGPGGWSVHSGRLGVVFLSVAVPPGACGHARVIARYGG